MPSCTTSAGLKRSMPCVDLNSMTASGKCCYELPPSSFRHEKELSSLEQAARSLLFENISDMAFLATTSSTSNKKRRCLIVRSHEDDEYEECKDNSGYGSDDSYDTPATAALERSMAETNSAVDRLELCLEDIFSSANSLASDEGICWFFDDSSFPKSSSMGMMSKATISHGFPSFHVAEVTRGLSRLSTTA